MSFWDRQDAVQALTDRAMDRVILNEERTAMDPGIQAALNNINATRLHTRIRPLMPKIADKMQELWPCAERCGRDINWRRDDFVFFFDGDFAADGIVKLEPYHRECAVRAYGAENVVG